MSKKNWRKLVPEEFFRGDKKPTARTVKQLMELLGELPPTLPVQASFSRSVKLTVYNIDSTDRHLQIEEVD